ncbi:MAG: transposase [Delftia sp.]|nr:transposase [Delftia sp.]
MGQGRPPKHLRFGDLLSSLQDSFSKILDERNSSRIKYALKDIFTSAFAIFFLQDPSLLAFQRRFEEELEQNNLRTVFGVEQIPSDTQLRDVIDAHENKEISSVFNDFFARLQRGGQLKKYIFLDKYYLIALDGSEYFTSKQVHCKKCLTKNTSDGLRYHHQILQSTIMHPDMKQVLPFAPEFIHNDDGGKKQDCEQNAGKRLIDRVKKDHPRLPMIWVGDGLYSKAPFINKIKEKKYSYILVAKPKDHKYLYSEIEAFRKTDNLEYKNEPGLKKGSEFHYEWSNKIPLNGQSDAPIVNVVSFYILKNGKKTISNTWVTDIEITEDNVSEIVRGGRSRWKIENESFNTLKNQGYHLDHNFGHGGNNLSESFFLLNLLAFYFHQIFELTSPEYKHARLKFSSKMEYWNCIRSMFTLFLIPSWNHLLKRINSPPKDMF